MGKENGDLDTYLHVFFLMIIFDFLPFMYYDMIASIAHHHGVFPSFEIPKNGDTRIQIIQT